LEFSLTHIKVNEIFDELKKNGIWKKKPPPWVTDFNQMQIATEQDFVDWLQFVYLPNVQVAGGKVLQESVYVVPRALKYFGDDIRKGRLLQLLVELDALVDIN
jgi:uncharacterized protein YqcC (DUF446 family)